MNKSKYKLKKTYGNTNGNRNKTRRMESIEINKINKYF